MNILEQICADKRVEVEERKKFQSLEDLQAKLPTLGKRPDFIQALRSTPMGLIAEVKRKSPSAGIIRDPFSPSGIASGYEANGASAVSCLMDHKYFGGGDDDFSEVRKAIEIPMLYKEFVVDSWQITHVDADLSPEMWEFLKKNRFFGMIIPKEYGGLGFSALAHRAVLQKVSSVCAVTASTIAVPNSLGPGELILHYGTDEQKNHYLPRLANGSEIPCFALTSPTAGCAMPATPRSPSASCTFAPARTTTVLAKNCCRYMYATASAGFRDCFAIHHNRSRRPPSWRAT